MSEQTKAADGRYTKNGLPRGFTSLTPFLAIEGAADAIDFYTAVFGARVLSRLNDGSGKTVHAELDFGRGRLQLGEPSPDYGLAAQSGAMATHSIGLYCPDADEVVERAVQHGATVREPLATFVSGDRFASILDPFGQRWTVMTRVEDLSDEESARRVEEWAAQQALTV
ncbi:VOC family protein [Hoyosella altamirensis]|uniref:PhnB protein n=1 Tax=Hoyosella altamirensis TaxID=616997 RepID=A0A839RKP5_9ACTN|nr:VOC family protein [Hoyosella altamirensis]MBB3036686.1 PhnB protein [Hoyosella altamirensis]